MKPKLFLDFDDVLAQSTMSFCDVYNSNFYKHPNFSPANYVKNNQWNFEAECPLLYGNEKTIYDIFESREFFNKLIPYKYVNTILEKWKNIYDYHIVTIGTKINLRRKIDYIDKNFPIIKNLILLNTERLQMDKSIVNMSGIVKDNILIDDHQSNLFSSNANVKILFNSMGLKPWNEDWYGERCADWLEVDKTLEKFNKII